MKGEISLHAGHRAKMLDKFYNNPDAFQDHELLEMLLFSFIPRRNTNDIAHLLINRFGSLKELFSASPEDVASIHGIGKKTASAVCLLGKIFNKIHENEKEEITVKWDALKNYKQYLIDYFKPLKTEKFLFVALDKKYNKLCTSFFEDEKSSSVTAEIPAVCWSIAKNNPKYAIIAHNHPSGNCLPSEQDDKATAQIGMLCYLHNVSLLDHVIISGEDVFSYRLENRLRFAYEKHGVNSFIDKNKMFY